MINKKALVSRHNPVIKQIELDSPLTVGNGEFAFTVDPTGMQSLAQLYKEHQLPLCTMAQWGWHTKPVGAGKPNYTLADLVMTEYDYENRKIKLPVEKFPGNEEAYLWLRHNPHRSNLAKIALLVNNQAIKPEQLTEINQQLYLYEGRLESRFKLDGKACFVTTICDNKTDTIGFKVESEHEFLKVSLAFPYGSPEMSGSDWEQTAAHQTIAVTSVAQGQVKLKRMMDDLTYYTILSSVDGLAARAVSAHHYEIQPQTQTKSWEFAVTFSQQEAPSAPQFAEISQNAKTYWQQFWQKSGAVDFTGSTDARAPELERRIVLSQYLLAIQSSGSLPPQETGLTCNSWHGKFHLEMHPWHAAWAPLWNQPALLEASLPWYREILEKAVENASKNGFKGARWPKQVANDGIDSPSPIAPLLLWQQPHLIYMLELIYTQKPCADFLANYWELVKESANFMCDYLSWNEERHCYELLAPIIPAQEEHDPRVVKNPTFELEYWRFALQTAAKWAKRLNKPALDWDLCATKLAMPPIKDALYLAHENCPDTFTAFNRDHPSMLGISGLFISEHCDWQIFENTLNKVLDCWEFETMWGWDFALMAMAATTLNQPELAIDILLMSSPKNDYVISGNNYQRTRRDLPLYLPGNGSLLLAVALMVAGYAGCDTDQPGIPKNGAWQVEFENVFPFFKDTTKGA